MGGNWWRYGLALGAGVVVGALGAMVLSRGSIDLKKFASNVVSHGMDLKEKAAGMVETARENMDAIAAEARQMREKRDASA